MRMAIYRGTGEIHLMGNRDGLSLGPGAHVDLDRVIGVQDGRPSTVADQLGPALLALCEVVAPAQEFTSGRGSRRPASQTEE
jgi:hypothetical protein